jgi:uncharacterized RDD family membrane protein YckC
MIPNLLHYSSHSKKISPLQLEMNKTPPEYKSWKTLVALFIDFYIVAMATSFMSFAFQATFSSLMASPKMTYSLKMVNMDSLSFSLLPLMFVSYYFFSFFMNEGQSYGMKKMKIRFENCGYDVKASLLWAARASSVIMTLGLSMMVLKDLFKSECVTHDHLYHELMVQREWAAPSLVERTTPEDFNIIEEEFIRAA